LKLNCLNRSNVVEKEKEAIARKAFVESHTNKFDQRLYFTVLRGLSPYYKDFGSCALRSIMASITESG
jgi:hypothetical protein